jgi:hypothetical protein
MFPSLSFSPTVNVNREAKDKDKEQTVAPAASDTAVSSLSGIDPVFLLMMVAIIFMSGAVLALSGALLVHAAKS